MFKSISITNSIFNKNYGHIRSFSAEEKCNQSKFINGTAICISSIESEFSHCNFMQSDIAIRNFANAYVRNCSFFESYLLFFSGSNFSVENCEIENGGLSIRDSKQGKIMENNISYCGYGITLKNSAGLSVKKNKITENQHGILIERSVNNTVYYNEIRENEIGIKLEYTSGNLIRNNNIYGNGYGIYGINCSDDALFNYWGSPFGPKRDFFGGDKISFTGEIKIFPWRILPVKINSNAFKKNLQLQFRKHYPILSHVHFSIPDSRQCLSFQITPSLIEKTRKPNISAPFFHTQPSFYWTPLSKLDWNRINHINQEAFPIINLIFYIPIFHCLFAFMPA